MFCLSLGNSFPASDFGHQFLSPLPIIEIFSPGTETGNTLLTSYLMTITGSVYYRKPFNCNLTTTLFAYTPDHRISPKKTLYGLLAGQKRIYILIIAVCEKKMLRAVFF
jgi:hypothetical protein